jgi:hypothetical protein
MMKIIMPFFFFFILLCGLHPRTFAQEIATLEVNFAGRNVNSAFPMRTELNPITHVADSLLDFVEVVNGQQQPVPFQIEHVGSRKLLWMLEPGPSTVKRTFKLIQGNAVGSQPSIFAKIKDGGIILGNAKHPLLRYNFATFFPPEGVDDVYRRSGFIHPLWSPAGKELTRIQPEDHYHHYGLWNPWTRVAFKGKTIDFWNLAEKQGTVRFGNFLSRVSGPVFGEFKVLHEHVVFQDAGEEIALNEIQSVRIYQQEDRDDFYIADISILLNCATDSPVTLKEYRYGGLGWRATEKWHKDNSETLTSEGKNRKEADGSLARWVIVQGEIDEAYAAVPTITIPNLCGYGRKIFMTGGMYLPIFLPPKIRTGGWSQGKTINWITGFMYRIIKFPLRKLKGYGNNMPIHRKLK